MLEIGQAIWSGLFVFTHPNPKTKGHAWPSRLKPTTRRRSGCPATPAINTHSPSARKSRISDRSSRSPKNSTPPLQAAVDHELSNPGWLPETNGVPRNGNGNGNGNSRNGNGAWKCSPKQKELILKLAEEHHLELAAVEDLAQERFGRPLADLNKLNASSLIDELLERQGNRNGRSNGTSRPAYPGASR